MQQPSLTSSQIFQFYESALKDVLSKHNPAGLNTIGALLKQFPGKEHQVYVQICKKCGVQPCDPPTPEDFVDGVPKQNAQPEEVTDKKVSDWLFGNKFEKYANQHQFLTMSWEEFSTIRSKGRLIELGVIPKHAQPLLDAIIKSTGSPEEQAENQKPEEKADFAVGENCFTKLVDEKGGDKWLNARITDINKDNTFDIFVYNSKAHGVPPEAVSVPRNMLKKSTEDVKVAVPENKQNTSKRAQFQYGDRVRVFGLRSHTSYNNLCGTVLLYVPKERRYQVRLDTNDVIAIKQRNVAPENDEAQTAVAFESGRNKLKKGGGSKNDEASLNDLMRKLMSDNPNADPKKLGEFAAGYMLAKQKLSKQET